VAVITARAAEPAPGTFAGIVVRLDGDAPQDRTPETDPATDPLSPGKSLYNFYSIEVIQRIGYDSFTPDNGVLIAKNKDREGNSGGPNGFNCFNWVIDARPEDIRMVDYIKPGEGTPVMRTPADYRQLNDALFHAGTNSGSLAEWEDPYNRLHFYILDKFISPEGILSYQVGVRSLDGAGPDKRGVTMAVGPRAGQPEAVPSLRFTITNTGKSNDIYRLSGSVAGEGWNILLTNELKAIPAGETREVKLYAGHDENCAAEALFTLKATSESDASATVSLEQKIVKR
jgi:hypothetical protein